MTGEVTRVHPGGQGERAGVRVGWYFETVDGREYDEELLDAHIAGQRPYEVTFKEGWHAGPVDLSSVPGKRAHHLLWQRPGDFEGGLEEEFVSLRRRREAAEEARAATGPLAAEEGSSVLRERAEEVLVRERRRTAAELLYLATCAELRGAGAAPVGPLKAGGEVDFGAQPPAAALTSAVHSPLALEAVEEHIARSLASVPARPSQLLQVPLFTAGQAYATSLLFGHVLRRAEERVSFERLLVGGGLGAGEQGGGRALQLYIEQRIGPGRFQDMITTREAQVAADAQVHALFGDLRRLRFEILQQLGLDEPGAKCRRVQRRLSEELEAAVERGQVKVLRLEARDLRRLLLEAVAFGSLLRKAEVQASTVYELTPSVSPRLDRLGIDTDENGSPRLPPE